jgi:hypothetical protein
MEQQYGDGQTVYQEFRQDIFGGRWPTGGGLLGSRFSQSNFLYGGLLTITCLVVAHLLFQPKQA